jgi:hypothetical protein
MEKLEAALSLAEEWIDELFDMRTELIDDPENGILSLLDFVQRVGKTPLDLTLVEEKKRKDDERMDSPVAVVCECVE